MNDPAAVARALGVSVDELADILRHEAAREFRELAGVIEDGEFVPDTGHASHLLMLIQTCDDEALSLNEEGGGVSTKEATSAGVAAPVRHDDSAVLRR